MGWLDQVGWARGLNAHYWPFRPPSDNWGQWNCGDRVVIFQIVLCLVCALYTSCVDYIHCYTLYLIDVLHVQYCFTSCTPC